MAIDAIVGTDRIEGQMIEGDLKEGDKKEVETKRR